HVATNSRTGRPMRRARRFSAGGGGMLSEVLIGRFQEYGIMRLRLPDSDSWTYRRSIVFPVVGGVQRVFRFFAVERYSGRAFVEARV
ncbi:MAG TPA: hypothetical protein VFW73_12855, partial [Lacipirellulaceae bacterium]|nr:hypothetical protein [Lacipirellulaceae bacterium]